MTIDKSWTRLRNRNDPVFKEGLENFIKSAKNHLDSEGKTYCPCKLCINSNRNYPDVVKAHIRDNGFLPSYQTWFYHGEDFPDAAAVNEMFFSNTHTPAPTQEMFDAIDDIMAEQNTREENISEDETYVDPEFDELFAEVTTELYPGCSWMSSLNFLAKMMHIKVNNKWTDTSFNQLLEFLCVAFPKENYRIPASYYEAKKKLKKIGLGYQSMTNQVTSGNLKRSLKRKETGKSSDIEGWRKMHYKMQTGWVNKKAEEDWEKIQIELNKMRNAQPEGEEIDEAECLTRALGERRGWTKGVGRKVRYTPYDPSCGKSFATPEQWQQMQQTVTRLVGQVHELTKTQNDKSLQIEEGEGDEVNEDENDEGSEGEDC